MIWYPIVDGLADVVSQCDVGSCMNVFVPPTWLKVSSYPSWLFVTVMVAEF